MHILILAYSYPDSDNPVRGSFYREQAQALKRAGHTVGVLVPRVYAPSGNRRRSLTLQTTIENDDGIATVRAQGGWRFRGGVRRMLGLSALLGLVARHSYRHYLRYAGQPDVIHAHCALYGGVAAAHLKHHADVPYVVTEHSSGYARGMVTAEDEQLACQVWRGASARLAVSPTLGNELEAAAADDFRPWQWVPNMVSPEFLSGGISLASGDGPLFLNIGALDSNKGQDDLLRAFSIGFASQAGARLILVGEGSDREALEAQCGPLGIADQVTFAGMLSRRQVAEAVRGCTALVLASRYETFGMALVEALAAGKPVVATDCGGPSCIVNERNGLLVPPREPERMAEAMLALISPSHPYDASAIREDCRQRFGEAAVVGQLESVYRSVIQDLE